MKLNDLYEYAHPEKVNNLSNKMEKEITDEGKTSIGALRTAKNTIKKLFDNLTDLSEKLTHKDWKNKNNIAKDVARELIQRTLDRTK